jgi:hypothetical protein
MSTRELRPTLARPHRARAEEAPAAGHAPLKGQPVEDPGTDETEPGGDDKASGDEAGQNQRCDTPVSCP